MAAKNIEEAVEAMAQQLLEGEAPAGDWPQTRAALQQVHAVLAPALDACGGEELRQLLLDAGTDLDRHTRFDGVGIHPPAEKGHVEVVRYLAEQTDINVNHTNFVGWTPLLEAIVLNDGGAKQQEIVKLLLDHGANPHMTDKYGKTPLELAREKGYHEIAELLIAAGA